MLHLLFGELLQELDDRRGLLSQAVPAVDPAGRLLRLAKLISKGCVVMAGREAGGGCGA